MACTFQPSSFYQFFQFPMGRPICNAGQLPIDPIRDKAMFLNIMQRLYQSLFYLLSTTILHHYLRLGFPMIFPERFSMILQWRLGST